MKAIKKIAVIGNACSGKTTLSRVLAKEYSLPLIHVDTIQFLAGMKLRPPDETRAALQKYAKSESWLIDGFGPLNIIESRFAEADLIIFLRLPLWVNYWWCVKRQFKGLFFRRAELPAGCFESTWRQTVKLFQSISNVYYGMWPQLDRIFKQDVYREKVFVIKSCSELNKLLKSRRIPTVIN